MKLKYLFFTFTALGLILAGFNVILAQNPSPNGTSYGSFGSYHLLFVPDATYDIGASGATRPRDLWLSRNALIGNAITAGLYQTGTNCSSSAAPAVCAAAPAGSVVIAAAGTTVTVNTTAVTANSQILLTFDSSLGTKLSVTCNTTEPALYGVTARTEATSFVITSSSPITNPACFSYFIVN